MKNIYYTLVGPNKEAASSGLRGTLDNGLYDMGFSFDFRNENIYKIVNKIDEDFKDWDDSYQPPVLDDIGRLISMPEDMYIVSTYNDENIRVELVEIRTKIFGHYFIRIERKK